MDFWIYNKYSAYIENLINARFERMSDTLCTIRGITAERELVWCLFDNIFYISLDDMKSRVIYAAGDGAAEWLSDEKVIELFINKEVETQRPGVSLGNVWTYCGNRSGGQDNHEVVTTSIVKFGRAINPINLGAITPKVIKHFRV